MQDNCQYSRNHRVWHLNNGFQYGSQRLDISAFFCFFFANSWRHEIPPGACSSATSKQKWNPIGHSRSTCRRLRRSRWKTDIDKVGIDRILQWREINLICIIWFSSRKCLICLFISQPIYFLYCFLFLLNPRKRFKVTLYSETLCVWLSGHLHCNDRCKWRVWKADVVMEGNSR